jgi:MFS family permease
MAQSSLEAGAARALLGNRPFVRLWAAQFSTVAVVYGLSLAGAVLVERQTHSTAQIGLVILSSILPAFLASLVSGAVVDRWGKVRVLIASHLARAVIALTFFVGTAFFPPAASLATIYLVNVAGAIFSQFAMPAELSLLPDLVESEQLLSANTLFQLSMLAGEGLGIVVLSPLVIKLFGVPAVGLVAAGLCFLALALVASLPRDPRSEERPAWSSSVLKELGTDLKAGWRTIAQDRLLVLVTAQATLAAALLLVLVSLVPRMATRHLGLGVEDAPFLVLPGGVGFLLGAYLMNRWAERMSRPKWIAVGLMGVGLNLAVMGLVMGDALQLDSYLTVLTTRWLVLPPILGLGMMLALVVIPARTVLQERPPAPMRGRVIAAQMAMANAAAVLPLVLGGALADQLGIAPVMGMLGFLAVLGGAIGLYRIQQ